MNLYNLDYFSALLRTQFNVQFGMIPPSVLYAHTLSNTPLQDNNRVPAYGDAIQIHYINGHFLVSYQRNTNITVYDSLYNESRTTDLSTQLQLVYRNFAACSVQYKVPQNQGCTTDCGPFAIANAYYILSGRKPDQLNINQHAMRNHLRRCLETLIITDFPNAPNPLMWYESYLNDQNSRTMEKDVKKKCSDSSTCNEVIEAEQTSCNGSEKQSHSNKLTKIRALQSTEQTAIEKEKSKQRMAFKQSKQSAEEKQLEKKRQRERMVNSPAKKSHNEKELQMEKNRERMAKMRAKQSAQEKEFEKKIQRQRMVNVRSQKSDNEKELEKLKKREGMVKKRAEKNDNQKELERERNREGMLKTRAKKSDGQKELEREQSRKGMLKTRAKKSHEQKELEKERSREGMLKTQAKKSDEQKELEKEINRKGMLKTRAKKSDEQKALEREQSREGMLKTRAKKSDEQKELEKERNTEAMLKTRAKKSDKQKELEKERNRERMLKTRAKKSDEQKELERGRNKEGMLETRAKKSEKQKDLERERNREIMLKTRAKKSDKQKDLERERNKEIMSKTRAKKSDKQKDLERERNREVMSKTRAKKSDKQNDLERERNREILSKTRAKKSDEQKNLERERNKEGMLKTRSKKSDKQKELEKERNREIMTEKRKLTRHNENKDQLNKERNKDRQRKQQQRHPTDIQICLQLFKNSISEYAKYVCTCCNRLLYKQSVTRVTSNLKEKIPESLRKSCIRNVKSAISMEWICNTCKSYLHKGKLPPQSNANNLTTPQIPNELKTLTSLEVRLLCQRYPFMKLLALPRGKQSGLRGTVVNVPVDHKAVCNSLPATPRQAGIIPLKLKRRIRYKGFEKFQYIRPDIVLKALHWLKMNNDLYRNKDLEENIDWEQSCEQEDSALWTELTDANPSTGANQDTIPSSETDSTETSFVNNQTGSNSSEQRDKEQEVDEYDDDPLSRLRGVKYDTCVQPVNPELDVDKVVNIAPGENQHPISILMDEKFEEMAFPHLLPYGKFGWKHKRKIPITAKKYFQKRLLDADANFAQDVEYLFVAQTITETKQIMDSMSFALRKCYRGSETDSTMNAGLLRDEASLQRFIFKDQAYRYLQPVRGSPPYWQKVQYKLLSAIKQFGIFTWFFTLSAADLKWYDTIQEIKAQSGVTITKEQIDVLSWEDKCSILRSNPVTAARHFQYRLDNFLKHVILSTSEPLGHILHYFYRIEFQQRGSPHAHGVLWIKDAPNPERDSDQAIASFVDKYISCEIPSQNENPELHSLVTQLQKHSHSASCRKTGKACRYNFPRPISDETLVTCTPDIPPEILTKRKEAAKETLSVVKTFLQSTDGVEDMSYTDVLDSCKIGKTQYQEFLKISSKSKTVHLKRSPSSMNINNYNKWLLLGWEANLDIQFVSNPYACIQYIVAYVTKDEREMGTLLQAVQKESADSGIKQQMKRCGQAFLNARSVTAQEAAYRVLGLPLHKSNFQTVWIPTGLPSERVGLLKPSTILSNLEEEDEDIFVAGILDKYSCRPQQIQQWFLALFASWYKVDSDKKDRNDFQPDVLEDDECDAAGQIQDFNILQEIENSPSRITVSMSSATYRLKKRTKQAVIRYHKFSEYRQPESYYHSQLLLFLPWRNEDTDLLQGFESYLDSYNAYKDILTENREYIQKYEQLINEALENADDQLVSAWDTIAPHTQQEQNDCEDEGPQLDPDHQILQPEENSLQDGTRLPEPKGNTTLATVIDTQPAILPFADYCKHMQSLNKEQYEVFQIVMNWCVAYRQMKTRPDPIHLFVSGGAGIGKSYLIKALYHTIQLTLNKEGEQPDLRKVLLLAPTGTAAYNIEGLTIHSAFLFTLATNRSKNKKTSYQPLSDEKRNTLRAKLSNLAFIIIDEISMVSSDLFLRIHNRLHELFGGSSVFGGVCIIAFGDMYQIPPVAQKFIFQQPKDDYAALAPSLWTENFQYLKLTRIMRQQEDRPFAEMLNRIRTGHHTRQDIELLRTRNVDDDTAIPPETLHVFPFNNEVNAYNTVMLHKLPHQPVLLSAVDKKPASMKDYTPSDDERYTGGLPTTLSLAIAARVMVIRNIDVSDGLVNGSQGSVIDFLFSEDRTPIVVLVKFDNTRVGENTRLQSSLNLSAYNRNAIPILPMEVSFSPSGGKVTITRKQFPLKLCWASSIHKVQGATVDRIAVSFERTLSAGKAYVALSRSRTLDGIYVTGFDDKQIRTEPKVVDEMNRLSVEASLMKPFEILNMAKSVTLVLLNARSARLHFPDIKVHPILQKADILCFTESHITETGDQSCQLDNTTSYILPYDPRVNCHGLAVYVKSNVNVTQQSTMFYPHMETMTIEVKTQTFRKKILLLYRSPSSRPQVFIDQFTELVSDLNPDIILGDFNLDILTTAYIQLTESMFQYRQLITKPTHNTGSTLDLAFLHYTEIDPVLNIYPTYFSDHSVVSLTFKMT